jgi:hypothetical protein
MANRKGGASPASSPRPRLDDISAGVVQRAREALEESRTDKDPRNFAVHLGDLETYTELLLRIISELTGGAS